MFPEKFSTLSLQSFSPPPLKIHPLEVTLKLSAILQPQTFEKCIFSRRFSAYGGDQQFQGDTERVVGGCQTQTHEGPPQGEEPSRLLKKPPHP